MSNLAKIKGIFKSHAFSAIFRWSKPVRKALLDICLLSVTSSLVSLDITLVTKGLIDGATGADEAALWKYGVLLVALIASARLISVLGA